jgi:hypothetical protein
MFYALCFMYGDDERHEEETKKKKIHKTKQNSCENVKSAEIYSTTYCSATAQPCWWSPPLLLAAAIGGPQ